MAGCFRKSLNFFVIFCVLLTQLCFVAVAVEPEPPSDVSTLLAQYAYRCSESLKGLSGRSETEIADELQQCSSLVVDMTNVVTVAAEINARAKDRLVETTERLLFQIRSLQTELKSDSSGKTEPTLAYAVGLENQLLHFLTLLKGMETWSTEMRVGTGVLKYDAGKLAHTLLGGVKFQFDLGNSVDGAVDLALASTFREENGAVETPVRSVDAFAFQEIWLRLKRARHLQFQLGRFENSEHFLEARHLPFFSLQGTLFATEFPLFTSSFRFRHDKLSFYLPEANTNRSQNIERNFSEVELSSRFEFSSLTFTPEVVGQFHWYADPTSALKRLSYGRSRPLAGAPWMQNGLYRVWHVVARVEADVSNTLSVEPEFHKLRNNGAKDDEGDGEGFVTKFKWEPPEIWEVGLNFYQFNLQCAATPPLQLPLSFVPGHKHTGVSAHFGYRLGAPWLLEVTGMFQKNSRNFDSKCGENIANFRSNLPRAQLMTSLRYEFNVE